MQSPCSIKTLKTLASPSMPAPALARVLADTTRSWAARLAQLEAAGVHISYSRARVLGSRLRTAGVAVERGRVVPLEQWFADNVDAMSTLVEQAGFDPAHWALAPRQGGYVTDDAGRRRRVAVVRHDRSPEPEVVAKLLASAMPGHLAAVPPRTEGGAYCLCLADFQTGKAQESRGGTAELVKRVRSIIAQARKAVELERPDEVFIFELGDVCENNANHTSQSQLASNDMSLAEQLQVCARLIMEAVAALAPLVPKLTLVCVRSNHGEERRSGQTVGRGDFGIMCAKVIASALELAGAEWAERVTVITQNALETGVLVHVQGMPVAAFHGHYAKSEAKLPAWIAEQAGGLGDGAGACYRTAKVVLHGHFHHLCIEQSRGRLIIGCPSLEAGSAWVERANGEYGEPGALVFRVRAGRMGAIEVLTPTAGMEQDRLDPELF